MKLLKRLLRGLRARGQGTQPAHVLRIIQLRRVWYLLSATVLLPGLIFLSLFGLRLGIDFTGGAVLELDTRLAEPRIHEAATESGFTVASITSTEPQGQLVSYRDTRDTDFASRNEAFQQQLQAEGAQIIRFERVGPSVSADTTRNALMSIGALSLAIVIYIAWAFRHVPPPVKPLHFGVIAIVALLHDALFVLGVFAILGKVFGIEVDSFFVTAVLTVIAFSIHDTIVVFDRVRENLMQRRTGSSLSTLINRSVNEVLVRSLNTSLVIIFVLLALFLFAGDSIRYFILALLIGMVSGTYSSIFLASPLLVSYYQYREKRR